MNIKLPGFIYSALLVALVAGLQALATGLDSLTEWWAPAAALLVAGALKAIEARKAKDQETLTRSLAPERSFLNRFFLG